MIACNGSLHFRTICMNVIKRVIMYILYYTMFKKKTKNIYGYVILVILAATATM